jgi:DNA polymerase-1
MTLHLIDASGIIHRTFHGLPPMARPSDNLPVGAVHGCCNAFWKLACQQPTEVGIVYDGKGGSQARKAMFPDYKAQRKPVHPDLAIQMPLARRAAEAFGFQVLEQEGVEADDLIATWTRTAVEAGHDVVIMSSDKDLMQLVSDRVTMFDPLKNAVIDRAAVERRWGVGPERMTDLLALMGDASDNIPGVPKIGEKTAASLINQYGNIEQILERVDEITKPVVQGTLRSNGWLARLSKKLVALDDNVPITPGVSLTYPGLNPGTVLDFMNEMEFVTLTAEIEAGLAEAA